MAAPNGQPLRRLAHNGTNFTAVKEGLAEILVPQDSIVEPKQPTSRASEPQSVFYNPIQQFNRDLSVLAIKAFGEDLIAVRQAKASQSFEKRRQTKTGPRGTKRKAAALDDENKNIEAPYPGAINQIATTAASASPGSARPETPEVQEVEFNEANAAPSFRTSNCSDSGKRNNAHPHVQSDVTAIADKQTTGLGELKIEFKILDALSATGLRALRFAKEIPFVSSVTANDMSPEATASIKNNIKHNGLEGKVKVLTGNALSHMYSLIGVASSEGGGKYDVIDLDPYGTAVPFLDAALQALKNGGLLCATFTDAGVWASCGYPERTFSLYGGTPVKGLHSHEGGLRLIIHAIASAGAKHGIAIEPLMSLSVDFYARVFVRVTKSPADVKFLAGKTMLVYSCDSGCGAWKTQFIARHQPMQAKDGSLFYKNSLAQGPTSSPHCEHCGMKTHMSGPMYGGPLHNPAFLESLLSYIPGADRRVYGTTDRIEGMLYNALEEASLVGSPESPGSGRLAGSFDRQIPPMDPSAIDKNPFFFNPSVLAKVIHCIAPSEAAVKGAIKHAGYSVARSHTKPGAIRTNAPWTFLWDMMREWVRQRAPIKEGAIKAGTAGEAIMRLRKLPASSEPNAASAASRAESKTVDGGLGSETNGSQSPPLIIFDEKLGKETSLKKLVRYQANPRANWGPMNRAKGPAAT